MTLNLLSQKIDEWANNPENFPENFSTTKIGEHIPCEYSMSTIWVFNNIENKRSLYRGKHYMKRVYESLREHAKNIIDFEKEKKSLLTKEELKPHQDGKKCCICLKRILQSSIKIKIIKKLERIVIIQVNIETQLLVFAI